MLSYTPLLDTFLGTYYCTLHSLQYLTPVEPEL